jgi:hypothetical protein
MVSSSFVDPLSELNEPIENSSFASAVATGPAAGKADDVALLLAMARIHALADANTAAGTSETDSTSSFLSLVASPSAPSVTSVSNASLAQQGVVCKEWHQRIVIVGNSGAGKSTLRHCIFSQALVHSLPDVAPTFSATSANSIAHPQGTRSAGKPTDRLFLDVVDVGPAPLPATFTANCVYVIVCSLATVKQKRERIGFFSGTTQHVIIHARDEQHVANHVHTIAVAAPGSSIFFVGTHRDVLSDPSVDAVEQILSHFRDIVSAAVETAAAKLNTPMLRFLGAFAVSCVDHKCVSENRGGPATIHEMWRFLCEMSLKDAKRFPVAQLLQRVPAAFASPVDFVSLLSTSAKFLLRLKVEHGVAVISAKAFFKVMFVLGAPVKPLCQAVLHALHHRGDILWFPGAAGRPSRLLMYPHLPSRIAALIGAAAGALRNHRDGVVTRTKSKNFNAEDVVAADPSRDLLRGVLNDSVIKALAATLDVGITQDHEWVFRTVAAHADLVFRLDASAPSSPTLMSPSRARTPASPASIDGAFVAERYVCTDLIASTALLPPNALTALRREATNSRLHVAARVVKLRVPVDHIFNAIRCRVGHRVTARHHVYHNAVWFQSPGGQCRCLVYDASPEPQKPHFTPGSSVIELYFVATTASAGGLHDLSLFVRDTLQSDLIALLAERGIDHVTETSFAFKKPDDEQQVPPLVAVGTAVSAESTAALHRLDLVFSAGP